MRVSRRVGRFLASSLALLPVLAIPAPPATLDAVLDPSGPELQRYFIARALQPHVPAAQAWAFHQAFAELASFVGEYDASPWPRRQTPGPAQDGYRWMRPAAEVIATHAAGRRVVIINEAHAEPRTRAVAFASLARLRAAGFTHFAMEALATMPVRDACTTEGIDPALQARGYPLREDGYYTHEPVSAELVREALRLGFKLVAYEHMDARSPGIESREQGQAHNLACLLQAEPQARVVVLVGHSHASKALTGRGVPEGGWMAARLAAITGLDPLTVDTTWLAREDRTHYASKAGFPTDASQAVVLLDDAGGSYTRDGFDLTVLPPVAMPRTHAGRHWLELGGLRRRVPARATGCDADAACVVEARPIAEGLEGTPADACVAEPPARGCVLFLRAGRYRLRTLAADAGVRAERVLAVAPEP